MIVISKFPTTRHFTRFSHGIPKCMHVCATTRSILNFNFFFLASFRYRFLVDHKYIYICTKNKVKVHDLAPLDAYNSADKSTYNELIKVIFHFFKMGEAYKLKIKSMLLS